MGMGVFQDELVPTHVEILPTGVEPDELGPDNNSTPAWDPAERSRITQLAAGAYHSLALSGINPPQLNCIILDINHVHIDRSQSRNGGTCVPVLIVW